MLCVYLCVFMCACVCGGALFRLAAVWHPPFTDVLKKQGIVPGIKVGGLNHSVLVVNIYHSILGSICTCSPLFTLAIQRILSPRRFTG